MNCFRKSIADDTLSQCRCHLALNASEVISAVSRARQWGDSTVDLKLPHSEPAEASEVTVETCVCVCAFTAAAFLVGNAGGKCWLLFRMSFNLHWIEGKILRYLLKSVSVTLRVYSLILSLLKLNWNFRVFCSKHDPGNRTNHYGEFHFIASLIRIS